MRLRASSGRFVGLRDLFADEILRLELRSFGTAHAAHRERAWQLRETRRLGGPVGDRGPERAQFDAGDPWRRWWAAHLRATRPELFFAAQFWADATEAESRALAQERLVARERLLEAARAILCTIDTACSLRPRCASGESPGSRSRPPRWAQVVIPEPAGAGNR